MSNFKFKLILGLKKIYVNCFFLRLRLPTITGGLLFAKIRWTFYGKHTKIDVTELWSRIRFATAILSENE